MTYFYKKQVAASYQEVLEKIKQTLATEGFGVLTEIDVKTTLKQKLKVDYDNYTIIGACNPPLAYQALIAEQEIGLLLPCNVIVYEKNSKVFVAVILPTVAMEKAKNSTLVQIAQEVEIKLKRAVDKV